MKRKVIVENRQFDVGDGPFVYTFNKKYENVDKLRADIATMKKVLDFSRKQIYAMNVPYRLEPHETDCELATNELERLLSILGDAYDVALSSRT